MALTFLTAELIDFYFSWNKQGVFHFPHTNILLVAFFHSYDFIIMISLHLFKEEDPIITATFNI
jgi:hypothetical protein